MFAGQWGLGGAVLELRLFTFLLYSDSCQHTTLAYFTQDGARICTDLWNQHWGDIGGWVGEMGNMGGCVLWDVGRVKTAPPFCLVHSYTCGVYRVLLTSSGYLASAC